MKLRCLLTVALAAFVLSACEETVETPNGEVPNNLLAHAQSLVGSYEGQFEDQDVRITLSMNGSKALVTTSADLLSQFSCTSQIGDLEEISYSADKKGNVDYVTLAFAFTPSPCKITLQGESLMLTVSTNKNGKTEMDARIFESLCRANLENPPMPPDLPNDPWPDFPDTDPVQSCYLYGHLLKI